MYSTRERGKQYRQDITATWKYDLYEQQTRRFGYARDSGRHPTLGLLIMKYLLATPLLLAAAASVRAAFTWQNVK